MTDRGALVRPRSQQAVPAAVALAAVAAAAWLALGSGVGHTTHDDVLGSGHAPDPAAVAALLGGGAVMVAAMMLPPEIASMAAAGPAQAAPGGPRRGPWPSRPARRGRASRSWP